MLITCELTGEKIYPNYLQQQFSAICVHIFIEECKIISYHYSEK